jgi:hypothetical protein
MNYKQAKTMIAAFDEAFANGEIIDNGVWDNPSFVMGERVLNGLTPVSFALRPGTNAVVVMDDEGEVIHSYTEPR